MAEHRVDLGYAICLGQLRHLAHLTGGVLEYARRLEARVADLEAVDRGRKDVEVAALEGMWAMKEKDDEPTA